MPEKGSLSKKLFDRLPLCERPLTWVAKRFQHRVIFNDFIQGDFGSEYGVTAKDRTRMVAAFKRNCSCIESATSASLHAVLARDLLSIPATCEGAVIECGTFKGASAASLSLVCRIVGRRLLVCDSFRGLPDEGQKLHVAAYSGHYGYYKEGMFCGRLEEVRQNISKYGCLDVCDFVPGFFATSLSAIANPLVLGFLDVDLVDSTRACLQYIWPRLVENGVIYSDDAGDLDVVRVFFDEAWWQSVFGHGAPGLVDSGCGLPISASGSSLGYIRKTSRVDPATLKRVPWLYYPESGYGLIIKDAPAPVVRGC